MLRPPGPAARVERSVDSPATPCRFCVRTSLVEEQHFEIELAIPVRLSDKAKLQH